MNSHACYVYGSAHGACSDVKLNSARQIRGIIRCKPHKKAPKIDEKINSRWLVTKELPLNCFTFAYCMNTYIYIRSPKTFSFQESASLKIDEQINYRWLTALGIASLLRIYISAPPSPALAICYYIIICAAEHARGVDARANTTNRQVGRYGSHSPSPPAAIFGCLLCIFSSFFPSSGPSLTIWCGASSSEECSCLRRYRRYWARQSAVDYPLLPLDGRIFP